MNKTINEKTEIKTKFKSKNLFFIKYSMVDNKMLLYNNYFAQFCEFDQ